MEHAVLNWSGGKDSAFCLYRCAYYPDIEIKYLLTTLSESYNRISMHGVRRELLRLQAACIGKELKEIFLPESASCSIYDEIMRRNLTELKEEGIDYSIFGDIFLEDLREYRESRLAEISMKGLFPLWRLNTGKIMNDFIEAGFKAVIVTVNENYLDKSFLGRTIDNSLLNDLPANVDPCGEHGEFHTFVYDGPIFKNPVSFEYGKVIYKKYKPVSDSQEDKCYSEIVQSNFDTVFWYLDLLAKA